MENQLVNVDAAQQARQLVTSSTAYGLVEVNAPEEEIRLSLSPEIRAAIPVALRITAEKLAAGGPHDEDEIVKALGRQIGLLKAGLAVEHKEDWIRMAFGELADLPPDMVLYALQDVRRSARFEGDVVPAVLAIVEPQIAKLQTERKQLEKLAAIAG